MRKSSQISSGKQIAQRPATINEHVIATLPLVSVSEELQATKFFLTSTLK